MKHFLFIILTLVCLLSCNKESEILVVNDTTSSQMIKPFMVSSENACKIAEDYINLLDETAVDNITWTNSVIFSTYSENQLIVTGITPGI